MHGYGVFRFDDGRIYEGEYKNNRKNGFGVFKWPTKKWYEGNWLNGRSTEKVSCAMHKEFAATGFE
jgi:hypothetical protein